MTKTLLFLTLILLAPVAGADEPVRKGWRIYESIGVSCSKNCKEYRCHFNENQKEAYCFEDKDQPAEEAKPEVLTKSEARERLDKTWNLSDAIIVEDNCPKIDCGLNNPSGKMCTFDKNGCAVYVEQSDAEKLRQECSDAIYDAEHLGGSSYMINMRWLQANTLCTRALLEEMRNK